MKKSYFLAGIVAATIFWLLWLSVGEEAPSHIREIVKVDTIWRDTGHVHEIIKEIPKPVYIQTETVLHTSTIADTQTKAPFLVPLSTPKIYYDTLRDNKVAIYGQYKTTGTLLDRKVSYQILIPQIQTTRTIYRHASGIYAGVQVGYKPNLKNASSISPIAAMVRPRKAYMVGYDIMNRELQFGLLWNIKSGRK